MPNASNSPTKTACGIAMIDGQRNQTIFEYISWGLPFKHDHFLIDLYLQGTTSLQSDIQFAQEININLTNPAIWQRFLRAMRRFDRLATIQLGYVKKQEYDKSVYRPGGVMAWTHGINSGRVCDRSSDAYGRWSSLTMIQKDE